MARQALQNFLHLPDGSLPTRERSRSPRGDAAIGIAAAALPSAGAAETSNAEDEEMTMPRAL